MVGFRPDIFLSTRWLIMRFNLWRWNALEQKKSARGFPRESHSVQAHGRKGVGEHLHGAWTPYLVWPISSLLVNL